MMSITCEAIWDPFEEFKPLPKPKNPPAVRKTAKQFHLIWLGTKPKASHFKNLQSWIDYHPDYPVTIWVDHPQIPALIPPSFFDGRLETQSVDFLPSGESPAIQNIIWLEKRRLSFGALSDIYRLLILKKYGGIYLDFDMACLQPIHSLQQDFQFLVTRFKSNPSNRSLTCNSFMLSEPNHPILSSVLEQIAHRYQTPLHKDYWFSAHLSKNPYVQKRQEAVVRTGPLPLLGGIRRHLKKHQLNFDAISKKHLTIDSCQQATRRYRHSCALHHMEGSYAKPNAPLVSRDESVDQVADRLKFAALLTCRDYHQILDLNLVFAPYKNKIWDRGEATEILRQIKQFLVKEGGNWTKNIREVIPPKLRLAD